MTDKSIADRIKDGQAYLWAVGVIFVAATTYTGMRTDIANAAEQYKRVDKRRDDFVSDQKQYRADQKILMDTFRQRQETIKDDVGQIKSDLRLLLERTRPK